MRKKHDQNYSGFLIVAKYAQPLSSLTRNVIEKKLIFNFLQTRMIKVSASSS